MTIDLQHLVQFLACPVCRSKLIVADGGFVCRSESCRLRFEMKDNIPVMLADEAKPLEPSVWLAAVEKAQ